MRDPRSEHIQALLDVEVALAEAEADAGVIAQTSVAAIRRSARADLYDADALTAEAAAAGNLLIPLVAALTRRLADDPAAAAAIHYGATSQDILDTALVVRLRARASAIIAALDRAQGATAVLAQTHAATPMAGRTWLQQASPTTFGLKAAGWLDGIASSRVRLAAAIDHAMVVQLGGPTGTLAALGDKGPVVLERFAQRLGLRAPDLAWHTQRNRLADLACALGLVCGALGKVGRDIALLAQTEVGEVTEPAAKGRGTSSSMPHKRNPVASAAASAASLRAPGLVATMLAAMPQEHERAIGGWQAEWDTLPALVSLTEDSANAMAAALEGLEVHVDRMRGNLDARGGVARAEGLFAALVPSIGREDAMTIVTELCLAAESSGRTLEDVARADVRVTRVLSADAVTRALDPRELIGSSRHFVDAALRRWRR